MANAPWQQSAPLPCAAAKKVSESRHMYAGQSSYSCTALQVSMLIEISSEVLDENSPVGGVAMGLVEARLGFVWAACRGVGAVGAAT